MSNAGPVGALHVAFLLGEHYLYAEGWLVASSSEIAGVSVIDGEGAQLDGEQLRCVHLARQDVVKVHARRLQSGARCFGYRLVAKLPKVPAAVSTLLIRLTGGEEYCQEVGERFNAKLGEAAKRKRLEHAPEAYGLPDPLLENAEYRKNILELAETLLAAVDSAGRSIPLATTELSAQLVGRSDPNMSKPPFGREKESTFGRGQSFARAHLDEAIALGTTHMFFAGWLADPDDGLDALWLRTHDAETENLLPLADRVPRPDVLRAFSDRNLAANRLGLIAFAKMHARERDSMDEPVFALVELVGRYRTGDYAVAPFRVSRPERSATLLTKPFFHHFAMSRPGALELLRRHIGPALRLAWQPQSPSECEVTAREFGIVPRKPFVSVIVPLFGRYDFLLYQLAEFSRDDDFQNAELIYMVDDPAIWTDVQRLAEEIAPTFSCPFRLLHAGRNLGYAAANNFAAQRATSERLVFLNSDVFPARAGWLRRMSDRYSTSPTPGLLGVRLLFEDDTIQHDGMTFVERPELPGIFLNDHPHKGWPARLAPEGEFLSVPAVTAACVMVDASCFWRLNGFCTEYIVGDFEDSDLCLAALRAGYKNYLLRSEKLYHLERQSLSKVADAHWRESVTIYNAWLHTERWGSELAALVGDEGGV